MAFTQEEIEYYHSIGLMPDWFYYQQSEKPVSVKLQEQSDKMLARISEQRKAQEAARAAQKAEKEFDKELEAKTEKAVEKALEGVLKKFKWN